jgi:hypothetical protein
VYREAFVFECALADRPFHLPQDGSLPLQFQHVRDLCRLMERILLELPEERVAGLLDDLATTPNRLSLTFLLRVLETYPGLDEEVTDALCRVAPLSPVILDLALPVPTWAFEKANPQPLHGWTAPEYFARMLPELSPALDAVQLQRVREAFRAC